MKIMHRDVKPQNIFLNDSKDSIKLGDFGISKQVEERMTSTDIGTTQFKSPEMLDGKTYNFKVEVWSFGCVAYELLTLDKAYDSFIRFGMEFSGFNENFLKSNNYPLN